MSASNDLAALLPPAPPEQTHREERGLLSEFELGPPATRLARARHYLEEAGARVEARHRAGISGLSVCRLLTESTDRLVRGLFSELSAQLAPPEGLCLVALGGYGRRELSPHSDLDLLLLRRPKLAEEQLKPFAVAFSTLLWDLKRVVGWSVRSPQECARAAEGDHTEIGRASCRERV